MREVVVVVAALVLAACDPKPPPPKRPRPQPAALVTPAEAPHLVAFVRLEEGTLYVVKPDVLASAIGAGRWSELRWEPGATYASYGSRELIVKLIEELLAEHKRAPQPGDLRLLDTFRQRVEHAEEINDCLYTADTVRGQRSSISIQARVVELTGEGDVQAAEQYANIYREHAYKTSDCREEVGFEDYAPVWIVERGPFPRP